jgi:hypothetical protein
MPLIYHPSMTDNVGRPVLLIPLQVWKHTDSSELLLVEPKVELPANRDWSESVLEEVRWITDPEYGKQLWKTISKWNTFAANDPNLPTLSEEQLDRAKDHYKWYKKGKPLEGLDFTGPDEFLCDIREVIWDRYIDELQKRTVVPPVAPQVEGLVCSWYKKDCGEK